MVCVIILSRKLTERAIRRGVLQETEPSLQCFLVHNCMMLNYIAGMILILTFCVDPNCNTPCGSTGITTIVCKNEVMIRRYILFLDQTYKDESSSKNQIVPK